MSTEIQTPAENRAYPWIGLAGFILVTLAAAWIGSQFTTIGRDAWYDTLVKPTWNPPNWLFGPVWTVLYLLMATAVWMVWRERGWRTGALSLYGLQLALNVIWSAIFFTLRNPGAALIEIVFLWAAVLLTTITFWKQVRTAGMMMLPYLVWVSFATALNFAIWRLNP